MQRRPSNWIAVAWVGLLLVLVVAVVLITTGRLTPKVTDGNQQAAVAASPAAGSAPAMANEQVLEKAKASSIPIEAAGSATVPEPQRGPLEARAKEGSNIRGGPGTNYPIVDTVNAGGRLVVSGKTEAGDWYELHDGGWVLADLLDLSNASALPVVTYAPGNYSGLGVSRAALQTVYGAAPFYVTFAIGADVDGQPQVLGRTSNGLAIVQLIGPAPDLTEASVTVVGSQDDFSKNATNVAAMVRLLESLVPNWTNPAAWLSSNMQAAFRNEVNTEQGKYLVSLRGSEDLGTLVVRVKATR